MHIHSSSLGIVHNEIRRPDRVVVVYTRLVVLERGARQSTDLEVRSGQDQCTDPEEDADAYN
jgi:hypothetical protein